LLVAMGAVLALGLSASPAFADVAVTTTTDEVQDNADCSLREAITLLENNIVSFDGCTNLNTGDQQTIDVPAGTYTLTRHGSHEDGNSTGDLDVFTSMTIQGDGAGSTFIDGDQDAAGSASDRVFDVFTLTGTITVAIDGVTIRNGRAPTASGVSPNGGGILTGSVGETTLDLDSDVISGNFAGDAGDSTEGGSGGGISNSKVLSVSRSTISGNSAGAGAPGNIDADGGNGGSGGGLANAAGTVSLSSSTVSGNHAGDGGLGLPNAFKDPGAGGNGGGLEIVFGTATLDNVTLAGNGAGAGGPSGTAFGSDGSGGGLNVEFGGASFSDSIVAASTRGGNCAGPNTTDAGHNLSFAGAGCPAGFATGNPRLGPLQDNGGATPTRAIGLSSAALDQGPDSGAGCPATDQRGVPRPQGPACDIGAFELPYFLLTLARSGSGSGKVIGSTGGLECGSTCSASVPSGTQVTLHATASKASKFTGWSGDCTGKGACVVTVGADQTIIAAFKKLKPPNTKITKATVDSKKGKASFEFKATRAPAGRFECALSEGRSAKPKFESCKSPKAYTGLKAGKYAFEVRAVGGGGTDSSPAKKTFKVD
jgi:CSLREA domain-containing protein